MAAQSMLKCPHTSDPSGSNPPAHKIRRTSAGAEANTQLDKQSTLPPSKKATVINIDDYNNEVQIILPHPKRDGKRPAEKAEDEYEEGVHHIKGMKPGETAVQHLGTYFGFMFTHTH